VSGSTRSGSPAVAVIGAGNVGCALAADLVLRGFDVRLCNRSPGRLEPLRRAGGLTVTGEVEGFAPLERITGSIAEAVAGADIVAVTVPTPALPAVAPPLIDATTPEQLLWLDPGHSGGALYLAAELRRRHARPGRRLCQLSTSSHGARMSGSAAVRVFGLPRATLGAFPGRSVDDCLAQLDGLFPGRFTAAATVLEVDLQNINAVLHPPLMVGNAGWIESTGGAFAIYHEGTGPALARLLEALDRERQALADRLGVPTASFVEYLRDAGYTTSEAAATGRVHTALQASDALGSVAAPATLDHRYLHEDVGWGLVPWLELARAAASPAPIMEALATVAGALNGVDYFATGLSLEKMGLTGLSPAEIVAYARSG
jgi:opine dehydrogenase